MKINSFEVIDNNIEESEFDKQLREHLAKDAQNYINRGELSKEYERWSEMHSNVEFHVYLDYDIQCLFAKELYNIY